MKALTIKELAPYLPYGLKFTTNYGWDSILTLNEYEINGDCEDRYGYDEIKPQLRPLSSLTKEITHGGETFIPMDRLFMIKWPANPPREEFYYNTFPNWVEVSHIGTSRETRVFLDNIGDNPHWIMQLLFSWHFDVFNLLENNLAEPIKE